MELVDRPQGVTGSMEQRSLLLDVSKEIVRLYKTHYGRGPTGARVDWAGPDALLCTLRDSFTPAERTIASLEDSERVRDTRLCLRQAVENDFNAAIERVVERPVIGSVTGIDVEHDISAEVFYFEAAS